MASGDTICVAIGEGSTYCIPSRGPLAAMPTPRPEEMNQSMQGSTLRPMRSHLRLNFSFLRLEKREKSQICDYVLPCLIRNKRASS